MKLILEKAEIVAIVGKHFELTLDPGSIVIRTEPLEIEITGIPLGEVAPSVERVVPVRKAAVTTAPAQAEEDALTPAAILERSKQLESELSRGSDFYAKRKGGVQSDALPADFTEDV